MKQYLDVLKKIMDEGTDRPDRTGVGSRAVFGVPMRFKMSGGFPAMTTKKLAFEAVKAELLWFLSGSSDVKELQKLGCKIWDGNAYSDYWKPKAKFEGDLGRVYGVQWRSWKSPYNDTPIDQITNVIKKLKENPHDRRIIVSAWNPAEIDMMALPPCHLLFQFFCVNNKLSLMMYQRSCDTFLGVPFNIASYSLLLHMVAQVTGLEANECIIILADAHIYLNHFDQVKEQMAREPFGLPKLWLNPEITDINNFKMEDIKLIDYKYHPSIKAPMAV
ncbi:MAG: thymidylate synthase [Candidatus Staskawiczbacteria bacterium RIFCSPLOWO2_01_FULL_40_39]|uniref:Thymidylate synthase n=1 Tax=Candidatus Staskawiczbacteria bacterium RIFCSPHIGHO2_01_FULL_39_25 TaxID=1802202 RepID=A0A1G2HPV0_9BACT|nr:MAG: thymidylate synthase [Candidatus Staskawiczbacteria bacterium RIFCSPHIGHO2_01_FULL_39_25]OGZ72849.1 MAG: thymidylate synthase [Candidatus Staskawiczbacteria bacterium RIFCSPLOWO2_01_FULL_40_39]OGZ75270.1 MAG: thymidylate synthase [Candidatus Staskawiczbacteria bacterium RIFCSPLOWO2_02_FULL_39_8]